MDRIIEHFDGDFEFLSNFSPYGFKDFVGQYWKTNEHFYQAHKTLDIYEFEKIQEAPTPAVAKRLGRNCKLRYDWNYIKVPVMARGLALKFNNEILKEMLLSTTGYMLVEGNTWHDNIWGNCKCSKCKNITGMNLLGVTLMTIRQVYQTEKQLCQRNMKGNCCGIEKKENF